MEPEFINAGLHKRISRALAPISVFCNKLRKRGRTSDQITAPGKDGFQENLEAIALTKVRDLLKELKQINPGNIYLIDNKDGDYLSLRVVDGSNLEIEVGHCCVVRFNATIPVAMLTAALSEWWENGLPTQWDKQAYGKELRDRIICKYPKEGVPPVDNTI